MVSTIHQSLPDSGGPSLGSYRSESKLKAKLEAIYHVLVSSAETKRGHYGVNLESTCSTPLRSPLPLVVPPWLIMGVPWLPMSNIAEPASESVEQGLRSRG